MSSLSSNPVVSQGSRYWHPCGHKQVQCFCLRSCATLKQIPGNFWLQTKPSEVTSAIDLAAWKLPLSLPLPGLSWLLGVWQKINTGYRWMYVINLSKAGWNPLVCGVMNGARAAEALGVLQCLAPWASPDTFLCPHLLPLSDRAWYLL